MKSNLEKRIRAAYGEELLDVLFINASLINTYTGKIVENSRVGVIDGVIVTVNPKADVAAREIIDCHGRYLMPALIDAHMHIESTRLNPSAYAQAAVPHGTGCIFMDPMQIVNTMGTAGIDYLCEGFRGVPLDYRIQFPSRVPATEGLEHGGASFSCEETLRYIKDYGALTLGEVNAREILAGRTLKELELALENAIMVNGHCPGLSYDEVMAASCAGLRDDHECETFEELELRLEAGMSVMLREGTIEPNCAILARGVVQNNIDTAELMFCTDDKSPEDMIKNGCIDNCIRIAISQGIAPITAIQMATINPARHFHVEDTYGAVAPGRQADYIIVSDLQKFQVDEVYYKGRLVAQNGKLTEDLSAIISCPQKNTIRLPEGLKPEDFAYAVAEELTVIEMRKNSLMTQKTSYSPGWQGNYPVPDVKEDILPILVIDRYTGTKHIGKALIKGLGIKKGAVASSCAQEGNNIVVSGTSYEDMLTAVKEIEKIKGGNVICIDGKIVGEKKLPVGGIMGDKDLEAEIRESREFKEALKLTGSDNPILMAALTVCLCPSIPEIGLTDMGIIENGVLVH